MSLPCQSSPVTCGAASLTMARAALDPGFAREVAADPEAFRRAELAAYGRTNNPWERGHGSGGAPVPWPMRLGTPPWGALAELRRIARSVGLPLRWGVRVVRHRDEAGTVAELLALAQALRRTGAPGLLYVGSASLPRHVVTVLPPESDEGAGRAPRVYDPARGTLTLLDLQAAAQHRLDIAGWTHPWLLLAPATRLGGSLVEPLIRSPQAPFIE